MRVEQVRVGTAAAPIVRAPEVVGAHETEEAPVHPVGALAVAEAGVKVHAPATAPAGGFESFDFQCFQCCFGNRTGHVLVPGISADKVRLMAVLRLPVAPVVVPFLQVAGGADLIRAKPGEHVGGLGDEVVVHGEFACRGHGIREAFTDDGEVRRRAVERGAPETVRRDVDVLRRGAGRRDEFAVFLHEPVHAELRGALQDRIVILQGGPVAGVEVVLPEVSGQPGTAHRPVGPRRIAGAQAHGRGHGPDVGIMARVPAARGAVQAVRNGTAVPAQITDERT